MSNYLTIDIDYWMNTSIDFDYLDRVIKVGFPIDIVIFHQEATRLIHKHCPQVNRIINVDYHSDVADIRQNSLIDCEFNEGTWVNYVCNPELRDFMWIYPCEDSWREGGKCHLKTDVFAHKDYLEFKNIASRQNVLPGKKFLQDTVRGSICLSPNWLPQSHLKEVVGFLAYKKLIGTEMRDMLWSLSSKEAREMVTELKMDWEERDLAIALNIC